MEKFSEHKSQHITCGKQGCTFSGHPKIVEKHFMMQHRTGLYNRIVKGNSPEEIEKWINERKQYVTNYLVIFRFFEGINDFPF